MTDSSAFPSEQHECQDGSWNQTFDPGMSLRAYFVGHAIAGLCANPNPRSIGAEEIASFAFRVAEAAIQRLDSCLTGVPESAHFRSSAHLEKE